MTTLADSAAAALHPQGRQLLAHDGQNHRHPGNERIHSIAIPLILLSLVGLPCCLHPWVA
jgi:uncharacterized membrane protein YGL010W